MAHLQYYNYPPFGEKQKKNFWYSQAVRIGDKIECAGQGGWNPETGEIYRDITQQIDQAFENVNTNLKHAGGSGWSQVYSIVSYHVPLNNEAMEIMVRNMKKWCPDHQPLWTVLGVQRLGEDDMRVEVCVTAHVP